MIEFTQIGDNVLPRTGIGADTFDEGIVEVFLAILRAAVATQEHRPLLVPDSMRRRGPADQEAGSSLQADLAFSTTKNQGIFSGSR